MAWPPRLLAASYPKIRVEPDAIWVQDGQVFTSAGVSAGIDLALALVEKDAGDELARAVAQSLVVFLQRPGGQSQFEPSTSQPRPQSDVLRVVMDAVAANPGDDHSVWKMAAMAAVSPRHLTRLFRAEMGISPARYVEEVRIDAGKRGLGQGLSGDAARTAGFGTSESMRRTFFLRVGASPHAYQQRFRSTMTARFGGKSGPVAAADQPVADQSGVGSHIRARLAGALAPTPPELCRAAALLPRLPSGRVWSHRIAFPVQHINSRVAWRIRAGCPSLRVWRRSRAAVSPTRVGPRFEHRSAGRSRHDQRARSAPVVRRG